MKKKVAMEKEEELCSSEMEMASQHNSESQRRKGGLVTMPFIIANEALARVATIGLMPNMILYLRDSYNLHFALATQILRLSSAISNLTPLLAALIADSYLGRFLVVGSGSIITFLGLALMWLTAMIPQARPPPCNTAKNCKTATIGQMTMLISSFALMSIGNGGLSCSMAFGADQVNRKDNPNNERALEIFFSWYYASTSFSIIVALTGIVYIQDHLGWKLGFGVPAACMLLSAFFFFLASPLYIKNKLQDSLITGLARVVVVAYKNRKLPLPSKNSIGMYHQKKGSDLVVPTDKLRFLNKACLIKEPEKDIDSDGSASNPCTIDQVEELKVIIKVIPLWSTGIMMSVSIGGSFGVLQVKSMNRHITSHFEVPPGSFPVIVVLTIFIWVALYDRVIIPLASKLRGRPVRISAKRRMGIGLFFDFLSSVTAAIVENTRRTRAIKEGYINDTQAVLNMSAMWLVPQLCLGGMAEAFNAIGQNEFYYTEFPRTMSSVASSLFGLGMAAGDVVSGIVLSIIQNVTSRGGREGWVLDNINKGHYDSWAYGPTVDQISKSKVTGENGSKEEALSELGNG
ncbi:PTR2 family proton/oligopeptide symporter, conserved site [Sesbania bispinosa]|nr:PTR2 family proton/oligopeptide symporter, conserved site [Sesbania bispinosa]